MSWARSSSRRSSGGCCSVVRPRSWVSCAGWFLGSALPIVVALVIAGIDVIETTVLLLVTQVRGGDEQGSDEPS
jgi:hypothetical protein